MSEVPWQWRVLASLRSGRDAIVDPIRLSKARHRASPLSENPLVSVIGPTFDRVDTVCTVTLPALLSQTYPHVEVILVGDGCADDVAERLAALESTRVIFRNLRRRSCYPKDAVHRWMVAGARPRNAGARLAAGELLLWMSDDDVLEPTAVERLLESLRRFDVDVSLGTVIGEGPPSEELAGIVRRPHSGKVWLARRHTAAIKWNPLSWAKYWNRPSDYDLFARLLASGAHFTFCPVPVVSLLPVGATGLHGSAAYRASD